MKEKETTEAFSAVNDKFSQVVVILGFINNLKMLDKVQ